jgi:cytoskeletal protein CcmA (bactofilin family)
MPSLIRSTIRPLFYLALLAALSTLTLAESSHDRTQVGHNITVGPDEEIGEATCFGCSVYVKGHVAGDVTTFGGSIVLEPQAEVGGDATTFGGNIRLDQDVKIRGDVTVFGGRIRRDSASTIGGDVTNMGSGRWVALIVAAPFVVLGLFVWFIVWLVRRLTHAGLPAAA